MGRTPKPLRFLVHPTLAEWPEFKSLAEQGHTVHSDCQAPETLSDYDLIMGPNCWVMDEPRRAYLAIAIQEARRARYPQQKKSSKVGG